MVTECCICMTMPALPVCRCPRPLWTPRRIPVPRPARCPITVFDEQVPVCTSDTNLSLLAGCHDANSFAAIDDSPPANAPSVSADNLSAPAACCQDGQFCPAGCCLAIYKGECREGETTQCCVRRRSSLVLRPTVLCAACGRRASTRTSSSSSGRPWRPLPARPLKTLRSRPSPRDAAARDRESRLKTRYR